MLRRISGLVRRFLTLSLRDQIFLLRAAIEVWRVRRRLRSSGVRDFRELRPATQGLVPDHMATGGDELPLEIEAVPARVSSPTKADPNIEAALRRTTRLVQASRHLLPGHCTCLELALTVQRMLAAQRIPSDVRIGVRRDGGKFEAHAWLESDGTVVMGGDDVYRRYTAMPHIGLRSTGIRHT